MSESVRRAGAARRADDSEVIWSAADGRRGRRWRAVTKRAGAFASSVLLEVNPGGRVTRLELATSDGLLTLHPEPAGSLHGNVVTATGVRHLQLAWSADHVIEVDPLEIAGAISSQHLEGSIAVGEGITVPVAVVGIDLSVREAQRRYVRLDAATWQIERDGHVVAITIDDRGLPVWPAAAESAAGEWPLELDPQP